MKGWPPYDLASKGHSLERACWELLNSYDNPKGLCWAWSWLLPWENPPSPLLDHIFGSMCKLDFWVCCCFVIVCCVYHLGLVLLIHVEALRKDGHLKMYMQYFGLESSCWNCNLYWEQVEMCMWTMKPGFLTDSFSEEFLNQVYNNREKKKDWRERFVYWFGCDFILCS